MFFDFDKIFFGIISETDAIKYWFFFSFISEIELIFSCFIFNFLHSFAIDLLLNELKPILIQNKNILNTIFDLNKFLKKIKKDKKYFISKKDIIFLEALKSDGIKISKKYDDLYKINKSEMPLDIQNMIDNKEIGATLLRLIEVIGPDKIENIDDDTVYFIINSLNQLNIDLIRNKLLLKVLPLKV